MRVVLKKIWYVGTRGGVHAIDFLDEHQNSCTVKRLISFTVKDQGPVVQSIVSSTSSLRRHFVKCFMALLPNILTFLFKKFSYVRIH